VAAPLQSILNGSVQFVKRDFRIAFRSAIRERVRIKLVGSFTNVLYHLNLANPVLAIDNPSVGQIASARLSDFGGDRDAHPRLTWFVPLWPPR